MTQKAKAPDLRQPLMDALRGVLAAPGKRRIARVDFTAGLTGRQAAEARIRRYGLLEARVKTAMASTNDPAARERLASKLKRVTALKARQEASLRLSAAHGPRECAMHLLEERPYKPTRRLTLQERRIDFQLLNEKFNSLQSKLEAELEDATMEEVDRVTNTVKNKLDAGDILGIAALAFLFRGKVRETLNKAVKDSYETGKVGATRELGIPSAQRPPTPLVDTQLMNLDSADIAEAYAANLEGAAKGAVKDGLSVGASVAAIVSSVRQRVNEAAARAIMNVSGTVVGQYVNRGRGTVLFDNISKVVAFQRSEVLDDATCDMCLSLDELVVSPDDPMARMEIVHTHCRGLWVPVFAVDEEIPEVTGIPKSIADKFDTVDGRPTVNAFTQLKKPVNDVSKEAQAEIQRRLEGGK